MESWQAIILGIVQGLTEFLPVSSSGHEILLKSLPAFESAMAEQTTLFLLVLHAGTLLAILLVYRADLRSLCGYALYRAWRPVGLEKTSVWQRWRSSEEGWLIICILAASIPTAIIGFGLEGPFEELFDDSIPDPGKRRAAILLTGAALLVTGCLLMASRWSRKTVQDAITAMPLWAALLIGVVQGIAITPGISRSGATIAIALLLGIGREAAGKFSFLLSVPAIVGALTIKLIKTPPSIDNPEMINALFLGLILSFIFGYLALRMLLGFIKQGRLHWWSWYCWSVGALALLWFGFLSR